MNRSCSHLLKKKSCHTKDNQNRPKGWRKGQGSKMGLLKDPRHAQAVRPSPYGSPTVSANVQWPPSTSFSGSGTDTAAGPDSIPPGQGHVLSFLTFPALAGKPGPEHLADLSNQPMIHGASKTTHEHIVLMHVLTNRPLLISMVMQIEGLMITK